MDLTVDMGNVSIGVNTASIGATIPRDDHETKELEEMFVASRVEATLIIDKDGDDGQETLVDTSVTLKSIADCNSLRIGGETYSVSLSFKKGEVDLDDLSKFAQQKKVKLTAKRIGDADDD